MDDELEQITAALAALVDRATWSQPPTVLTTWLDRLQHVATQVAVVQAGVVRELSGQGWATTQGASSMPVWVRDHLHVSIHTARRLCDLGTHLHARPHIGDALTAGKLTTDQAAVINNAVTALPDNLDRDLVDQCEAVLLSHAVTFEPQHLSVLGQRVLDHVAPQIAEAALGERLDREEQAAAKARTFTMTAQGNGRIRLGGWLDTEAAAVVHAALDPLTKPVPGPNAIADPRTPGQRRADALVEICRLARSVDSASDAAGQRAQLHITVDYNTLTQQLGVGTLDSGQQLSAATVRRMACDATILPAVLGTHSEILDLGRTRRLFVGATRRALILRDRGCAFPHCDRAPAWCQAHHIVSWLDGGPTNLDNGVLLCGFHHRHVHHTGWTITLNTDRRPQFIPPPHIDPHQRPQTNPYHRRP